MCIEEFDDQVERMIPTVGTIRFHRLKFTSGLLAHQKIGINPVPPCMYFSHSWHVLRPLNGDVIFHLLLKQRVHSIIFHIQYAIQILKKLERCFTPLHEEMSPLEPIVLYSHPTGPNPWKVVMILEELEIPFKTIIIPKEDLKKPSYEKICINGRAPAVSDPNHDITLWESGAIIEYLVDHYDKDLRLGFAKGTVEYYHAKQWLYFQVSGQGPYFGQAMWFKNLHPDKIPSAISRYIKEIKRVSGVLDRALGGKEWLVGGKFSFADLAFVPWYDAVEAKVIGDEFTLQQEFPSLYAWLGRCRSQPGVARARAAKAGKPKPNP